MIRFRMLGTVDLRDSQDRELGVVLRRPKLLGLLGYLAVARPRGFHRRDVLVALLWPDLDHKHARNALRQAVHDLRSALSPDLILARGEEELGIGEERLWSDVREFDAALEAGAAERALDLYRGGLLTGFHLSEVPEFERWLDDEREGTRRRACEAARVLADREAVIGNAVGAARWAQRLTELSPYDEIAVRRLVELLDQTGDRAGAVRAYEEFERRLGRDLEVQPSLETQDLVAGIRGRQQPQGATRVVPKQIATDGDGTPAPTPTLSAAGAVRHAVSWPRRVAVVLTLVTACVFAGWHLFRAPLGARSAETARAPKRIVVLPFTNLGPAEDQYFADGVTEEITTRLATIDRLRVIGRTSANAYKGTKKTLHEIGAELGVDYAVEGAVRWDKPPRGPARVRITPQVVSTADGTHLWAQVYDEPLDEIFRVQSDIAENVVQALDVAFPERQRRAVAAPPTRNLEAYDFYLRGKAYLDQSGAQGVPSAACMWEKAVELDSTFALAYAGLAMLYTRLYWHYQDHSAARIEQARRMAERARALAPDLPDTHRALAIYYGLGVQDYDRSMREFAAATTSDPDASLGMAVVLERAGRWRESRAAYERALQLDPAQANPAMNYGRLNDVLREYPRAEALYERAIVLAPDRIEAYTQKMWMYMRWDGTTHRARQVLRRADEVGVADHPHLTYARILMEIFDQRYDSALVLLSTESPEIAVADHARVVPRAQLLALIYTLTKRPDLARAYFDSCRIIISKMVARDSLDPRLRTALGIAYAGVGRNAEAIQQGKKAAELMPISRDAFKGYHVEWELARIYVMTGEHDRAISELEYLLSIPGNLTSAWLRMDPVWNPLRRYPRFQKLVGGEP